MMKRLLNFIVGLVYDLGDFFVFLTNSLIHFWYCKRRSYKFFQSIYDIGFRCIIIIIIVGLFTGMVMGLQMYYTLIKFGASSALGTVVSLSIVRELGPVLTALMIIGQSGSSLTSEIAIMRNNEQIDALKSMGINPLGYICGPKIYAALISFPILTTFFDLIGIFGGYFSVAILLGIEGDVFWNKAFNSLEFIDLYGGYIKSFIFALLSIAICTYEGYNMHLKSNLRGVRAVSHATTKSVVKSSIIILISDYLITSFIL